MKSKVCALHFTNAEVKTSERIEINGEINIIEMYKPRLVKTAIPTIFPLVAACKHRAAAPPPQIRNNPEASTSNVSTQESSTDYSHPTLRAYARSATRTSAEEGGSLGADIAATVLGQPAQVRKCASIIIAER